MDPTTPTPSPDTIINNDNNNDDKKNIIESLLIFSFLFSSFTLLYGYSR